MGEITDTAAAVYRDFVTSGLPASGANEPVKGDIRSLFTVIDSQVAILAGGGLVGSPAIKSTRSALYSDLAHAAGTLGVVYGDTTATYNGLYAKVGSSGSGSWTYSGIVIAPFVGLSLLGSDVTSQLLNVIFDQLGLRYWQGKKVTKAWTDSNYRPSIIETEDGHVYIPQLVARVGVSNGMTIAHGTDGALVINNGATEGILAIGDGGDTFDTSTRRVRRGVRVSKAWGDSGARASIVELEDGRVEIPALIPTGVLALEPPLESTSYLFSAGLVGGLQQLFRTTKATGVTAQITSSGNNGRPSLSADGASVNYASDRNGLVEGFYQPVAGGADHPLISRPVFPCWGDSLTNGYNAVQGQDFVTRLGSLLAPFGHAVENLGWGGQTSQMIAERMGVYTVPVTLSGNQIVAGANSVTAINGAAIQNWTSLVAATGHPPNPCYQFLTHAKSDTLTRKGTLCGVHGVMTMTDTGTAPSDTETYTFTPDTGYSGTTACPVGSPFQADLAPHCDETPILWLGRNNAAAYPAQVLTDIAACVASFAPKAKRYLVMSVLNGAYEGTGTTAYTNIVSTVNAGLAAAYSGYYLDIRTYLVQHGLADAGITPTTQDTADIAADIVPSSLRTTSGVTDSQHLNAAGYNLVATQIYNFLVAKGWT
ncbi:MAG: hypothetical protein P4L73_13365 [Caulobacteraceae bacterium]|nr:hypothetical protein [Caulobacteraceae bacterium]